MPPKLISNIFQAVEASAQRNPQLVALRMFERSLTYAELIVEIEKVAGGLRGLGVVKGDRVGIFSENCPEYLVIYLAVAKLGAILATINPLFKEAEIGYILANAEPRVIFVQAPLESLLSRCCELSSHRPHHTIRLGSGGNTDALPYEELVSFARQGSTEAVDPNDGVVICYTSGSLSRPKPVFRSHQAELFLSQSHAKVWHIGSRDKTLVALPLSWLFGLTTSSIASLSAGAAVVLIPHFNPVVAMEQMESQRITLFAGVMTMFAKMLQVTEESSRDYDLSSLRFCVQGGEPRNESIVQRFTAKFKVAIHDIYSSSECCPNFTYDPYRDPQPRSGSCGRLLEGVEVRLLDETGRDVSAGVTGELVARCLGMMIGYYREPEATAEVIQNGWFLSHDLVRRDEDGYYYIVGRAKDLIIRGGANIAPAEVEAVLTKHPAVAEAAVIGLPDAVYGEQPVAFIVRRTDQSVTPDELQLYCCEYLAKFKVPTQVLFVDQFPKGATGKILKRALRDIARPNAS
jgi:long-chain acyl-CoA synthetase